MEDFLQKEEEDNRKKKQEYLRGEILNSNMNAQQFSEFIGQARHEGQNIDNWRMDELETVVALYKRQANEKDKQTQQYFEMEDIELEDSEEYVYAKKILTEVKAKTIFSDESPYIMIEGINVVDGGYFSSKQLSFTICVPSKNLRVVRLETSFKWLLNMLENEFPFIPIPPLLQIENKLDIKSGKKIKHFYEKFLNEVVKHKNLRTSLALEIFLTEETKQRFDKRSKELKKLLQNYVMIKGDMTRKKYDYISNKNPINQYLHQDPNILVKISSLLKQYYICSNGQYEVYQNLFDQLEKLQKDYQKQIHKLIDINLKFRDIFLELKNNSLKFNNAKCVRNRFNMMEDQLFASVTSFFDKYEKILQTQKKIYQENIGDFSSYMKEYLINVKKKVDERNFLSNEYYKEKMYLNQRKNKKVQQGIQRTDLDKTNVDRLGLDIDFLKGEPRIARKFMFKDDTKSIRRYGDLFALFNYNVFNEMLYFEEYFLKSVLGTFKNFADRNIENITQNHLIYAEMLSELADINSITVSVQVNFLSQQCHNFIQNMLSLVMHLLENLVFQFDLLMINLIKIIRLLQVQISNSKILRQMIQKLNYKFGILQDKKSSQGVIIVFDLTSEESFQNVNNNWLKEIKKHCSDDIQIMLIGNKNDLSGQKEVDSSKVAEFAQQKNMIYYEASALEGTNVYKAFERFTQVVFEKNKKTMEKKQSNINFQDNNNEVGNSNNCCN